MSDINSEVSYINLEVTQHTARADGPDADKRTTREPNIIIMLFSFCFAFMQMDIKSLIHRRNYKLTTVCTKLI